MSELRTALSALADDITPEMEALADEGKWKALWFNLRRDLRTLLAEHPEPTAVVDRDALADVIHSALSHTISRHGAEKAAGAVIDSGLFTDRATVALPDQLEILADRLTGGGGGCVMSTGGASPATFIRSLADLLRVKDAATTPANLLADGGGDE